MAYQEVTNKILTLCKDGDALLQILDAYNQMVSQKNCPNEPDLVRDATAQVNQWANNCIDNLEENELLIERENFRNHIGSPLSKTNFNKDLSHLYLYIQDRKKLLIDFANEIERKKDKKELAELMIDDIDSFVDVQKITILETKGYAESAFLEDDVENAFLDALGEPYKESDSGSEIRDLFTDKLVVKGKRLSAAIMLKGRGVKGPLTLRECGKNGNQLLKLSKNTAAQCFVVQHVNKIEQDVRDTLIDHVLMNSRFQKVYVCFIDGVDTARFLKGRGLNLDELKAK